MTTQQDCLADIDVVILAGGLGTRLAPVLADRPKILAPVGDRPYLAILLAWLQGFGARRIIMSLGHLAEKVVAYLDENMPPGVEIVPVVEAAPLGTAGAVGHVRGHIRSDPALVMNGDSFVDADLCAFVQRHRAVAPAASIICTEVADCSRYGTVTLDEGGYVDRFEEKNSATPKAGLINAGIYLFGATLLDRVEVLGQGSLEHDLFEKLDAGTLLASAGRHVFLDIGTPDDLARAPALLAPYVVA